MATILLCKVDSVSQASHRSLVDDQVFEAGCARSLRLWPASDSSGHRIIVLSRQRQTGARWNGRMSSARTLGPEKMCAHGGGIKAALYGAGAGADAAETSSTNCSSTTRSLSYEKESWFRSLACTVMISTLCLLEPLGDVCLALSDCNDLLAYYAPLHGLQGDNLKSRLHYLIKDHRVIPYIQAWDALKVLDEAEDDQNSVIEIYSLKKVAKSLQAKKDGWNREHLWPRSYGLVMGRPEFSDLQNLRPADVNVNSSRGNKYFGECMTSSHCMVPANGEAAPDTGTNKVIWMPPAQVRGDVARAVMYMAVRYGGDLPGSQDFQLSDSPVVGTAQMGRLLDLLHWNDIDPPSDAEKLRNSRVCSLYQHNRNPFIDHPEYAKSIWGGANTETATQEPSPSTTIGPLFVEGNIDAWINEFHYDNEGVDQDEFVEVAIGPKVNPDSLIVVLYNGGDGRAYRSLPLSNRNIFSKGEVQSSTGFSLFVAKLPSGALQNGPKDGIALVQEGDDAMQPPKVLQLLSYEGTFKARDGPAEGLQSLDVMVNEDSKTPPGSSLGLTESGQDYEDFRWSEAQSKASPGSWNFGQTLRKAFTQLLTTNFPKW